MSYTLIWRRRKLLKRNSQWNFTLDEIKVLIYFNVFQKELYFIDRKEHLKLQFKDVLHTETAQQRRLLLPYYPHHSLSTMLLQVLFGGAEELSSARVVKKCKSPLCVELAHAPAVKRGGGPDMKHDLPLLTKIYSWLICMNWRWPETVQVICLNTIVKPETPQRDLFCLIWASSEWQSLWLCSFYSMQTYI